MMLYIVRHAIAVPHGTPGVKDNDRPLTEEGIKKMRRGAAGLRSIGYVPELMLTSPLMRATQTADLLMEAFGAVAEVKVCPSLAPGGVRRDLYDEIARFAKKIDSIMLVGHQPSLGEIAGEMVCGPNCFVDFKKGGACAIEVEIVDGIPKGTLISLLTPSILHKIAS